MKQFNGLKLLGFYICFVLSEGCNNTPVTIKSEFAYTPPIYNDIQLIPGDSITFPLSQNTYNEIKSFNYFQDNGAAYISFFDNRSSSVNIYNFKSCDRIKKIKLKKWIKDNPLYKSSVYIKNFDSIFISNQTTLYLFDSSGAVKKSIDFYAQPDRNAFFDNEQPPIMLGDMLYMGIRPWVSATSFPALKNWKILYGFDMKQDKKALFYSLPEIYKKNIYGYPFLAYSYCFNNKGNFVFSFPADTNIYETNLASYNKSYNGKSRYQSGDILPVSEKDIKENNVNREFRIRDSYGPIYYDALRKRYLRLAKQKISLAEYTSKKSVNRQSIIIFDEHFRIIAEAVLNTDIVISSLFFTADGKMYARVNPHDEYALHFIGLSYVENVNRNKLLTKK